VAGTSKALILVVERDPQVQALERYFLEHAGFAVDLCDNGDTALDRARINQPVILISEILVPVIDGLSVCRKIKGDPKTQHIIVLVFSILAAEDRAFEAGADAFLRKPINDIALIQCVERLLAKPKGPPHHGSR
jgi:CheY-like chemotaxis protein